MWSRSYLLGRGDLVNQHECANGDIERPSVRDLEQHFGMLLEPSRKTFVNICGSQVSDSLTFHLRVARKAVRD